MKIHNSYGGSQGSQVRLQNNPIEDIDWSGDVFADYLAIKADMEHAKAALKSAEKELNDHRKRENEARQRKEWLADHGTTEADYDAMLEADHEVRRLEFAGRDIAGRKAARLREYQEKLEKFQRYDYAMKSISVLRMGIATAKRNIEIEQARIEEQKISEMRRFDAMLAARQNRIDADNEFLTTIDDVIARLKEAGLFKECALGDREMNAEALNMVRQR